MNIKWACIISGVMLLLAIPTGMPYDYYIVLRWVIFLSSIFVAYVFYKSHLLAWTFIFGGIAFLFNPIAPIYLSKESWVPIDLIASVLFFVAAYSVKKKK